MNKQEFRQAIMRFIALLISLSVLTPSQSFAEVSAIVEDGKAVGVESRDTQGNVQWTVRHLATEGIQELRGPLYLDGKWVYSIGGDVLTLSDDGKVIGRTQYPALISHLRVEDQKLWVTLKSEKGNLAEVPHSESHHAQRVWSNFHEVALRPFTDLPVEIRGDEVSREEWEEALPDLIVIEETDLTNPISSAYLGLAYQALGQNEPVVPAFERAIARSTTWSDDLKVCGILEGAGKPELAYHVTKPDMTLLVSFLVLGILLHLVSVILYARSTTPRTKSHS